MITVHSLWWKLAIATRVSLLPFGWGRLNARWSAVSSVAADHVRRTLPWVDDVQVVPNIVETDWWRRPPGLPDHSGRPISIVLVGRLKKRKHLDEFLDALARARRWTPEGTLVAVTIVGEGPRRSDLEQQIARLGLSDWVSLVGQLDATAVRALLHSGDLFVVSSRQESFGLAALEARSAGLPVVGYRGNGLVDYIEHDVDGLLVSGPTGMTEALVRVLTDEALRCRLKRVARETRPTISCDDALRAVSNLYQHARSASVDAS